MIIGLFCCLGAQWYLKHILAVNAMVSNNTHLTSWQNTNRSSSESDLKNYNSLFKQLLREKNCKDIYHHVTYLGTIFKHTPCCINTSVMVSAHYWLVVTLSCAVTSELKTIWNREKHYY